MVQRHKLPAPARASGQALGWMSGLRMPLEASTGHGVQGGPNAVTNSPAVSAADSGDPLLLLVQSADAGSAASVSWPPSQGRASNPSPESQKVSTSTLWAIQSLLQLLASAVIAPKALQTRKGPGCVSIKLIYENKRGADVGY